MTRDEARQLIQSYCYDSVSDEEAAVQRLLARDLTEFARLNEAGATEVQDALDELIYGEE